MVKRLRLVSSRLVVNRWQIMRRQSHEWVKVFQHFFLGLLIRSLLCLNLWLFHTSFLPLPFDCSDHASFHDLVLLFIGDHQVRLGRVQVALEVSVHRIGQEILIVLESRELEHHLRLLDES